VAVDATRSTSARKEHLLRRIDSTRLLLRPIGRPAVVSWREKSPLVPAEPKVGRRADSSGHRSSQCEAPQRLDDLVPVNGDKLNVALPVGRVVLKWELGRRT
jgi:hypothetical protein